MNATTFESLVRLVSSEGCSAATVLTDLCTSMSSASFVVPLLQDLRTLVSTAKACAEEFALGLRGGEFQFEELRSAAKVCLSQPGCPPPPRIRPHLCRSKVQDPHPPQPDRELTREILSGFFCPHEKHNQFACLIRLLAASRHAEQVPAAQTHWLQSRDAVRVPLSATSSPTTGG